MKSAKIGLLVVAALIVAAWAFRHDYVRHSDGKFHMVNRWTGEVTFVHQDLSVPVVPYQPSK